MLPPPALRSRGACQMGIAACLNYSECLWIHSQFSDITVIMQMSLKLAHVEVSTDIRNPWMQGSKNSPVSYLQNFQCSGTSLLRRQFHYIFLYRVYLAALVFVIRATATENLSGALIKCSAIIVAGFLSVRTDFIHPVPSSFPTNWTKLNQTKPVLWFSKLTMLWKT